jgi:Family of unknown function (DUF5636)
MAGPTWVPVQFSLASVFGAVPRIDRYQRIYDYLNDQTAVDIELRAIDQATASKQSFEAFLSKMESQLGFSSDIKTILRDGTKEKVATALGAVSDGNKYVSNEGIIRETAFMQILSSRRPIVDLGVLADHGNMTHRVQWVMIGMWDRRTRALGLGDHLANLYQGLAGSNARAKKPVPVNEGKNLDRPLWDLIFDSFNFNATHPEYLHSQHVRNTMPGLFAKWS